MQTEQQEPAAAATGFPRKYMSVGDTCSVYGVSRATVDRWIKAGRFRAIKAGAKVLVDVASADAYFINLPLVGGVRRRPSI
jgi:excisionase family DNA binding protein